MNKVILIGRLARDPDVRYMQEEEQKCMARYTLAVDRPVRRENGKDADFITCIAFGRQGEFAEKYLIKGMKIAVIGHIQTGSYTNRDGQKIYTTDVVIESQEFCESKEANDRARGSGQSADYEQARTDADGFLNIPDQIDEDLPFH